MEISNDEGIQKDYKPLIAELRSSAEEIKDSQPKLSDLLSEAAISIESLSDFSIDLVDLDGTIIYTVPDEQVKMIMVRAMDDFIQNAISSRNIEIPEEKLMTHEEAEEFEKQYEEDI